MNGPIKIWPSLYWDIPNFGTKPDMGIEPVMSIRIQNESDWSRHNMKPVQVQSSVRAWGYLAHSNQQLPSIKGDT